MWNYIKALRLPICVLAGFLTIVGFKITNHYICHWWLPALTVLTIACSTMTWNDYRDREQDLLKGKDFVYKNSGSFLVFAILLWCLSIIITVVLMLIKIQFGLLALGMIIMGFMYSERWIRKICYLPNATVALTSASPLMFPATIGKYNYPELWIIFIIVILVIYAREICKDLDDIKTDILYKWTLPQSIGREMSIKVICLLLTISTFLLLLIGISVSAGILIGAIIFVIVNKQRALASNKVIRWAIDIGTIFLFVSLIK